jgi:lipopolysaccharide transport system permease protein
MKESQITEYYPNQRFKDGFFSIWKTIFRNVVNSKDLVFQLFKRDFFAQYKKSFLGVAWAVITPIFGIASWVLMQLTGVLKPGEMEVPYPVYILVGSTCWGFFMSMISSGSSTLSSGSDLIQQIKYPHEALLFKQILLQLVNFVITLSLVLIVISIFGYVPSWKAIFLPVLLLPLFFLGAAIGLMLAMINVVAVDISRFVNHIMTFLIYTAPIIYSPNVNNHFLQIINKFNPLTYLVCSVRDMVLFGRLYGFQEYFWAVGGSILIFLIVWRAFYVNENKMIERMI